MSFVFLGSDPLNRVGVATGTSSTQPSAVCVCMHTYVGPGLGVGSEACLGSGRLCVENGGLLASTARENGWGVLG